MTQKKPFGDDKSSPSVDCLMVALPILDRVPMVKQSIADFIAQTYEAKSLIIVINGGIKAVRNELRAYISQLDQANIRLVEPDGDHTLAELRNISLSEARSDLVCQWDDDDRNHPQRLEKQIRCLIEGDFEAVYLQDVMQYFSGEASLFWINWRTTPLQGHPGTLLAKRSESLRYRAKGAEARLGEDSVLARDLIRQGHVGYLADMAHLFIYVTHASNSWPVDHHLMLQSELAISKGLLKRRETSLRAELMTYGFKTPVRLQGNNGEAFVL